MMEAYLSGMQWCFPRAVRIHVEFEISWGDEISTRRNVTNDVTCHLDAATHYFRLPL